jgi:hypothetical protein
MKNKDGGAREFKFVDPKNYVAFRKIFGDENREEIHISFLNTEDIKGNHPIRSLDKDGNASDFTAVKEIAFDWSSI